MASIPQIARKSWAYTATADGESAARGTGYLDIHYYTPVRRGASSSCSCRLDKFVLSTDSLDQMILLLLLLLQLRLIVLALPAVNDDGETERDRERERRRRRRRRSSCEEDDDLPLGIAASLLRPLVFGSAACGCGG